MPDLHVARHGVKKTRAQIYLEIPAQIASKT